MKILDSTVKAIETFENFDKFSAPLTKIISKNTQPRVIKNTLSGTWLGHQLHPMVTDLPIGAWLSAAVLDAFSKGTPSPTAKRLVGFGILAAIPAAATGSSDWSDTIGAEQRVGFAHGTANSAALVLQGISYLRRRQGKQKSAIALSTIALGITAFAGYLGGHLTLRRGMGVDHTAFQDRSKKWTKVASLSDLNDDKPYQATVGDVPVVLVSHDGSVYALSNTCAHAGGPLAEGTVEGDCITCPWHGSIFRINDGQVVRGPSSMSQPSWQVRIINDAIEIRSGE